MVVMLFFASTLQQTSYVFPVQVYDAGQALSQFGSLCGIMNF